jgi:hypothetical protein
MTHSLQGRDSEANVLYFRGLCSRQIIEGSPQRSDPSEAAPPDANNHKKPRSARKAPSAEKYVPPGSRNPSASSPAKPPKAAPTEEKPFSPADKGIKHGKSRPKDPKGGKESPVTTARQEGRRGEKGPVVRVEPVTPPPAMSSQECCPCTQERLRDDSTELEFFGAPPLPNLRELDPFFGTPRTPFSGLHGTLFGTPRTHFPGLPF